RDRGRRLATPRGLRTRPTPSLVREALFDIVGPAVAGMRILDLFAGSGAVGIEALSRGAARAVFVERDRDALRVLRTNLATLGAGRAQARVVAGDAVSVLASLSGEEGAFDLVFVDPPYEGTLATRVLAALPGSGLLGAGARVVVQHFGKAPVAPPPGLSAARTPRRFGETTLTFLKPDAYTPPGSEA
ncbi:MAG TPA: 16S rRNA (guanine(966)-N(2))-methyltransferase RsmD, partial [Methylomirabilota bacterium]|nr:16S rRNA (guanine(966)-N(2))-methyltransferase RsmD [Methylomirabilota bacterium]